MWDCARAVRGDGRLLIYHTEPQTLPRCTNTKLCILLLYMCECETQQRNVKHLSLNCKELPPPPPPLAWRFGLLLF